MKYEGEKYAMGIDLQTTKRHPPYSHTKSPEANYRAGLEYAKEHHIAKPKLWVARSLMQLANISHRDAPEASKVFKEAAEMAYREYNKERKVVV
jgi:hypothetical protein